MILVGIRDGDILIVDRSVDVKDGDIVLAVWEGNQPTCKVLCIKPDHIERHSRDQYRVSLSQRKQVAPIWAHAST